MTDPSGAVIAGASVTLTNQDTQAKIAKVTSSTGDFSFAFVPVGTYTLTIEGKGFRPYVASGMRLRAGQQIRQSFALELGSVTETVKVEASTPLVNTVSAQQLQNYSLTDARELPLQNRDFTALLKTQFGRCTQHRK